MELIDDFFKIQAEKTIKSLQNNNIQAHFIPNSQMLPQLLDKLIDDGQTVGFGGSLTLKQTHTLDYLRSRNINLLDREKEGLTRDDLQLLMKKSLLADVYLCSSNAITLNGEIYNVDGNGNRVAAMLYGPSKVIVIAGVNKLVNSINQAILRVKSYAAPLNALRLSCDTPCKTQGKCFDCKSDDRICCSYVLMSHQRVKNRICVLLVNENLGF